MKKILSILGLVICGSLFSQDIPFSKLYGHGDPVNYYLGSYPVFGSSGLDINWYGGVRLRTSTGVGFQLLENGNVGIGTDTPQAKFDVNFENEEKAIRFFQPSATANPINSLISSLMFTWYNNHADMGIIRGGADNIIGLGFRFNGEEKVRFTPVGNASFQGKIEAKEIKVTLTPTADFVFDENYDLPKLEDIEKHIKDKKHLPEIASAAQMEKEGVNVGEFQIKLLQKIEELTLYLIEQNKHLKSQSEQLRLLQEENKTLKSQSEDIKELKKQVQQILSIKK